MKGKSVIDLEAYFWDALRIIEVSLDLIDEGQPQFYRVIAGQLRLLLCDTARVHDTLKDISLMGRLYPGIYLQPIGKKHQFDYNADPIPLNKWLDQKLPFRNTSLTIRKLIRMVCEQDGGVHVDQRDFTREISPKEIRRWITRIGEYIAEEDIEEKSEYEEE
jgi:hypothetical protein